MLTALITILKKITPLFIIPLVVTSMAGVIETSMITFFMMLIAQAYTVSIIIGPIVTGTAINFQQYGHRYFSWCFAWYYYFLLVFLKEKFTIKKISPSKTNSDPIK